MEINDDRNEEDQMSNEAMSETNREHDQGNEDGDVEQSESRMEMENDEKMDAQGSVEPDNQQDEENEDASTASDPKENEIANGEVAKEHHKNRNSKGSQEEEQSDPIAFKMVKMQHQTLTSPRRIMSRFPVTPLIYARSQLEHSETKDKTQHNIPASLQVEPVSEETIQKITEPANVTPGSLFLDALAKGQVDKVKEVLDQAENANEIVNRIDEKMGFTPLMNAVSLADNAVEITKILLEKGANPNLVDGNGNSCVHWAAKLAKINVIRLLLEWKGTEVNIGFPNHDGDNELHLASCAGSVKCVTELLSYFQKDGKSHLITARNMAGQLPFDLAASGWVPKTPEKYSTNKWKDGNDSDCGYQYDDESALAGNGRPRKNSDASTDSGSSDDSLDFTDNQVILQRLLVAGNYSTSELVDNGKEQVVRMIRKQQELRLAIHKLFYEVSPFHQTLVLKHNDCLLHLQGTAKGDDEFWESPERLVAIYGALEDAGSKIGQLKIDSNFPVASKEMLMRAHTQQYVDFVFDLSSQLQKKNDELEAISKSKKEKSTTAPAAGQPGDKVDGMEVEVSAVGSVRIPSIPFTPRVQRSILGVPQKQLKKDEACDTGFSEGTLASSLRAAGSVVHAIDCVVKKQNRNAICLVRPPGHHAGLNGLIETAGSCGFCIFNNVMVGALHAISQYPDINKVAIIDFDVHHGNGTEEIIRKFHHDMELARRESKDKLTHDPKILFFSSHLYDKARNTDYEFYPGSGADNDSLHNIINVPMQPLWTKRMFPLGAARQVPWADRFYADHFGRSEFRKIIIQRLLPALRAFEPNLIIISAGFDAARRDLGNARFMSRYHTGFNLQRRDFWWVTNEINKIANMCCEGRVVSVLEGGYGRLEKKKQREVGKVGRPSSSLGATPIPTSSPALPNANKEGNVDIKDNSKNLGDISVTSTVGDTKSQDVFTKDNAEKGADSNSVGNESMNQKQQSGVVNENEITFTQGRQSGRSGPASWINRESLAKNCMAHIDGLAGGLLWMDGDDADIDQDPIDEQGNYIDNGVVEDKQYFYRAHPRLGGMNTTSIFESKKQRFIKKPEIKFGGDRIRGSRPFSSRRDDSDDSDSMPFVLKRKGGAGNRAYDTEAKRQKKAFGSGNDQAKPFVPSQQAINRRAARTVKDNEVPENAASRQDKLVRKEDALVYLTRVKNRFDDRPDVYQKFLSIMAAFKDQTLTVPLVMQKVRTLFSKDPDLLMGFNTFLPPGYSMASQDYVQATAATAARAASMARADAIANTAAGEAIKRSVITPESNLRRVQQTHQYIQSFPQNYRASAQFYYPQAHPMPIPIVQNPQMIQMQQQSDRKPQTATPPVVGYSEASRFGQNVLNVVQIDQDEPSPSSNNRSEQILPLSTSIDEDHIAAGSRKETNDNKNIISLDTGDDVMESSNNNN